MLRFQRGEPDAALAEVDRALELDPHSSRAWYTRGTLRAQQGDARGLEDFEHALTLVPRGDPRRTMLETGLVNARERLGR